VEPQARRGKRASPFKGGEWKAEILHSARKHPR